MRGQQQTAPSALAAPGVAPLAAALLGYCALPWHMNQVGGIGLGGWPGAILALKGEEPWLGPIALAFVLAATPFLLRLRGTRAGFA